jgi:lipopolysaccharide biosynthesis glycosyltransferase
MAQPIGMTITHHDIEAAVESFPAMTVVGSQMTWARVVLADVLADLDRVLYVDGDTLTVQSALPLWEESLDGAVVAAVTDVHDHAHHPYLHSLGIGDPAEYFNAGVVLIDLGEWRRCGLTEALVDFVEARGPHLRWHDQDALNVVCAGRRKHLHPRWNAMNSLWRPNGLAAEMFGADTVAEAIADPAILHFEGPSVNKPWHYLSRHPWRASYRAARHDTPWSDVELEDRTIGTRAIGRLPGSMQKQSYAWLRRARAGVRKARALPDRGRRAGAS